MCALVNRRWPLLLALALSLLAAAPLLLGSGFLNTRAGGDSPFLLFRLHQLHAALADGVFPVRWMPDAAYGLGYPFFNFYAALPYYLAAAFKSWGFSYVASVKLTHLAGFLLAAAAMYAWTRRHMRTMWGGLLASAAYTFAPFHMVNVYVRGDSLSEFWAFAWYPLILFAADRLFERRSGPRTASLALAYAGLLLTHNLSALIFSPFLALYLLIQPVTRNLPERSQTRGLSPLSEVGTQRAVRLLKRIPFRAYATCALALALGFMLATWFWLPSVAELHLAQLAPSTTGYFHYSNHFRGADLVQTSLAFDYSVDATGAITPFAVGNVQALMAAGGTAALLFALGRRRRHDEVPGRAFAALLIVSLTLSIFLITPGSRFLWDSLPVLAVVQFPWRFLSVAALFAAALTGYIADLFVGAHGLLPRLKSAANPFSRDFSRGDGANDVLPALAAVALSATLAVSALPGLDLDFILLSEDDVTPERLQLYEYFTGNIGTTIRYEWLPNTVNPRPYTGPDLIGLEPRAKPLSGDAHGVRLERRAASQRWTVIVESERATVALPLHYWPGWRASADGRPVDLSAAPGLGWAQMTLPRGQHTVTLWLDRTPIRAVGEWLSVLALLVTLALLRPQLSEYLKLSGSSRLALERYRRLVLAGLLMLCAIWVGLRVFPEAPVAGPLTMDFARQAYPYHMPKGIAFGEALRLAGYDYSTLDSICPQLTVLTDWARQPEPPDSAVSVSRLTLPATDVLGIPIALAVGEEILPGANAGISLWPPCPLSPGVYVPTLSVVSRQGEPLLARTASGDERAALTLAPVYNRQRLTATSADRPLAAFGDALVLVGAELRSGNPNLLLRWRVDAEIPRNYHVGLRLRDVAGNLWAEQDAPLGLYGAYPPALWTPGELVRDFYALPVPPGMPPGEDYRLQVSVYDAATNTTVGATVLAGLRWDGFTPASGEIPAQFAIADYLSIGELIAPEEAVLGQPFTLTIRWIVELKLDYDFQAEWTLRNTAGENVWSVVTPLAPGSAATRWVKGALVEGRLHLDPPATLAPSDYTLTFTLLGVENRPVHEPLTVHRLTLKPAPVPVGEPEDLPNWVKADFGGLIRLWGYDAAQTAEALTLTLTWGALAETDTDYAFFVHLFDPTTEAIPAQVDTMPHGYTHPTSTWIPGEIVTDTVDLDLRGVPPGDYRVAVGWYHGADRLPAYDANGARLDLDRVILPLSVVTPAD